MTLRVERAEDYYTDESGERFQQLFLDAEARRESFKHGLRLAAFWTVTFGVLMSAVLYKLLSMGAIIGLR